MFKNKRDYKIDPWFINQIKDIVNLEIELEQKSLDEGLYKKLKGFWVFRF